MLCSRCKGYTCCAALCKSEVDISMVGAARVPMRAEEVVLRSIWGTMQCILHLEFFLEGSLKACGFNLSVSQLVSVQCCATGCAVTQV
jgi:hypothetical protein